MTIITVRSRYGQTSTVPACPSCVEEIANYHYESLIKIGGPSAATECESCRQGWVA